MFSLFSVKPSVFSVYLNRYDSGRKFVKPKILLTAPIAQAVTEQLHTACELRHWTESPQIPRAALLEWAGGVDGILCMWHDKIDGDVLDAAGTQLKVVSTMSVGYDHIDMAACRKRGINVGNTPGVLTETTAELAMALLLATARRIPEAANAVKAGAWGPWQAEWMAGRDIHGSTVGLVGLGRIGAALGRMLSGFGCRILYTGPRPKPELADPITARYANLDTLLAESDFVSLHCPLNAETRHLVNRDFLGKMKRSATLINTTRGGVVDQDALYHALHEGVIAAAGLDVTTPEPLPAEHKLLTLANCVILPHIGSASLATRTRMAQMAADNLVAGVTGAPLPNSL